jgi:hypothetical protein
MKQISKITIIVFKNQLAKHTNKECFLNFLTQNTIRLNIFV